MTAMATSASANKRLTTLQARTALIGGTLHPIDGDDGRLEIVMTIEATTQRFRAMAELESWLDSLEGGSQK